jgi:hypothetical protein
MSAMGEFASMKKRRDDLARLKWQCTVPSVRMFYPDDGRTTAERDPDQTDKAIISQAVCDIERSGSGIAYYGGDVIGMALKQCTLRFMDKRLVELALKAKEEATACLAMLKEAKVTP